MADYFFSIGMFDIVLQVSPGHALPIYAPPEVFAAIANEENQ